MLVSLRLFQSPKDTFNGSLKVVDFNFSREIAAGTGRLNRFGATNFDDAFGFQRHFVFDNLRRGLNDNQRDRRNNDHAFGRFFKYHRHRRRSRDFFACSRTSDAYRLRRFSWLVTIVALMVATR